MTGSFCSFLLMTSKIRAVFVEGGDSSGSFSFQFDDIDFNSDKDDLKNVVSKLVLDFSNKSQKNELFLKSSLNFIVIPANLMSAAVFGITEHGSLKSASFLAKLMLLDVKKTFKENNFDKEVNFDNIDVVVISGGYDDSENAKTNSIIMKLSESVDLINKKPAVLFAGSSTSLSFAKLRLSPLTNFFSVGNALLNISVPDIFYSGDNVSTKKQSSLILFSDFKKTPSFSFSFAIQKISEIFCSRYIHKVMSILFTKDYSVINECEKISAKSIYKRYGIPVMDKNLKSECFSEAYSELFLENNNLSEVEFFEKDLFDIEKQEIAKYYRPERIVAISVSEIIGFEKFLDLISDPDLIRGIIEFVFDKNGVLLALTTMFFEKAGDYSDWLMEISLNDNIISGWIIIPDGRFVKDKPALTVYAGGSEAKNETVYLWGKRYVVNIEPFSVIEIQTAEKVYFDKIGRKKVLKTGKDQRTMIIDLRKEKS